MRVEAPSSKTLSAQNARAKRVTDQPPRGLAVCALDFTFGPNAASVIEHAVETFDWVRRLGSRMTKRLRRQQKSLL
jgi:hypothetical protein